MPSKKRYFIIHKPYKILSQFSDEGDNPGLGTLFDLPKDVYPVGRLDLDSEGLLILTNDKRLNSKLLDPKHAHTRTYWVEVEGQVTHEKLGLLASGVTINLKGNAYKTKPANVVLISPKIDERDPPVNHKKHPVRSWLQVALQEGKNRQIRRMTAKVGHPTLRLVRVAIEDLALGEIKPGEVVQLSENTIYRKLRIS